MDSDPYSHREQFTDNSFVVQSLKETFAEKIPGEIEKVKKLRKYVIFVCFFPCPHALPLQSVNLL